MWYFIIFAIIVISISILSIRWILGLYRDLNNQQEKNSILTKEQRVNEIKTNALLKINDNIKESLEKLDKIKGKNEEKLKSKITCDLKEQANNIDALLNNNSEKQIIKGNLKDELDQIIKNIDGKIKLEFPTYMDIEVQYDQRVLAAIKMLLLNSVKIDKKNLIRVAVSDVSKNMVEISIENVKLVNEISDMNYVSSLLNISSNTFEFDDFKANPDFMIIRQNLIHSAKKVEVELAGPITIVRIVLKPEKLKRKRNNIMALVVDDNKPTAKMNQEVLKEIGIDSKAVYSADECMKEILTTFDQYDIIITDNQMPEKNGTDLIRDLKKIDGFNLPVVIVTGDRGESDYFLNTCGFDGYIEKPLDKKKALKTIKKLIK